MLAECPAIDEAISRVIPLVVFAMSQRLHVDIVPVSRKEQKLIRCRQAIAWSLLTFGPEVAHVHTVRGPWVAVSGYLAPIKGTI